MSICLLDNRPLSGSDSEAEIQMMRRMPKVGVFEAQNESQWAVEVEVQVKVREEVGTRKRALWPGLQWSVWSDHIPLIVLWRWESN